MIMAKEIERKFLVTDSQFIKSLDGGTRIVQAYLSTNPDATVRIRIMGNHAFLTVKSRNVGISRGEWEYEIPIADAEEMIEQCGLNDRIVKTRYRLNRWEIDVFHEQLEGLVIAEIEMTDINESIQIPHFIGQAVSDDPRYFNSNLLKSNILNEK